MPKKLALIRALLFPFMLCAVPSMGAERGIPPRIGILSPLSAYAVNSAPFEAFRGALSALGYTDGKNVTLVYRWADGNSQRLSEFANELVSMKVDVIVSGPGTPAAMTTKRATSTIPIVFFGVGDAVGTGIVQSLVRPGGNATGLVNQSQDIAGKQLEVLNEAIPKLSRVGVLWRPSNPSYKNLIRRFDAVVATTRIEVVLIGVETREELLAAFEEMKQKRIQGLIVQADELFIREGKRIVELAAAYRMPSVYRLGEQVTAGGLMAYGPSVPDMYRRTAFYVDKILKGAKPGELPVEQPTKVELVINQKTARQLGLVIPSQLLVRADRVIEQ